MKGRVGSAALASAALMALGAATGAQAAGNAANGAQAMQQLNAIVFGNLASSSEIEGKTFVGGNLTGASNYGNGRASANQGSALPSDWPTLTVVGDASGNLQINNGANGGSGAVATIPGLTVGGTLSGLNLNAQGATVKVGGNLVGSNLNGSSSAQVGGAVVGGNSNGASVSANLGAPFRSVLLSDLGNEKTQLFEDVSALSTLLGGMATTAGSGFDFTDPNNVKLQAVAGDAGFAVINIDAGTLFGPGVRGLSYDFTPGLTTIVNVTGNGAYSWGLNTLGSAGAFAPDVLFNFVGATSLTLGRDIYGSILAPFADIASSSPINGTLVAGGNFAQSAEVHLGSFGGINLDTPGTVPGVPEPASWALLIAGFGLVGGAMRRRRSAPAHLTA